jgi:hypothetical protein
MAGDAEGEALLNALKAIPLHTTQSCNTPISRSILITNNAAEQALRHWVIARRISQGTHSEAGTRAFALLASVIETCRKRSAPSWTYIASALAAARQA